MNNKIIFKQLSTLFILFCIVIFQNSCDVSLFNEDENEILEMVKSPVFSITSGTVNSGTEVTITTETPNATIWYSVGDGTQNNPEPDTAASGVSGSSELILTITEGQTIKTIACAENMTDSVVVQKIYIITVLEVVKRPVFSINSGSVDSGTEITITSETPNATIWYSIGDGTQDNPEPDTVASGIAGSSKVILTITEDQTIKVIASAENMADSVVVQESYNIAIPGVVISPSFSINSGSVDIGTEITITTETPNATIWYSIGDGTQDNPEPDTASSGIAGTSKVILTITEDQTIKAIASADTMTDSVVVQESYNITIPEVVEQPVFNITSGTVDNGTEITITTETPNATIWYSIGDGTQDNPEPDTTSSGIAGTSKVILTITEDQTIKAIASADTMTDSVVVQESYNITIPEVVEQPVFNITSGTVDNGTEIIITTETPNATLWYSVGDGSQDNPVSGEASSGITGTSEVTITISEDQTIKVIASADTMTDSAVIQESYILTYIIITDVGDNKIIAMDDINGANCTTFGKPGIGINKFDQPTDIFVDNTGRIYIVDSWNNRIIRMDDITGTGWTTFGSEGLGIGEFMMPSGIYLDSQDRIYITDFENSRIVRIDDMDGTNWTEHTVDWPMTITLDSDDRIYFNDVFSNRIGRMDDMEGTNLVYFGETGDGINQFSEPMGMHVNNENQIFIADFRNNRIVKIDDMIGTNWVTFQSGEDEDDGLNEPTDITGDSSGKLYISDAGNSRIIRIDNITGENWIEFDEHTIDIMNFFSETRAIFVR